MYKVFFIKLINLIEINRDLLKWIWRKTDQAICKLLYDLKKFPQKQQQPIRTNIFGRWKVKRVKQLSKVLFLNYQKPERNVRIFLKKYISSLITTWLNYCLQLNCFKLNNLSETVDHESKLFSTIFQCKLINYNFQLAIASFFPINKVLNWNLINSV